jgi:membrane associated rhomboid family serine protease
VFPLRDDNPTLRASVATLAIVGLNAAAWVFVQGLGTEPALGASICELGAVPGELLGTVAAGTRVPLGQGQACVLSDHPVPATLLTHMFLHGGWFHLLGNLWFLWVFGDNVEDAMGPLRFVVFYLVCGLAAVGAQMLSRPDSAIPMVGASGAIGGVMGAYARLYPRAPVHLIVVLIVYVDRIVVPAFLMLGYWLLLQVVGGIPALSAEGGGVAFWAHIGGFVAGLALVGLFADRRRLAAHQALVARRVRGIHRERR